MSFWFFKRKIKLEELTPWQHFLQRWQQNSGGEIALKPLKKPTAATSSGYWLIGQERVLAVLSSEHLDKVQLEQLMRVLLTSIEHEDIDASQLQYFYAPVTASNQIFMTYEEHALEYNAQGLRLWIDPALYTHTLQLGAQMHAFFTFSLAYHLLPIRFKERDKSLSVHMREIKRVKQWVNGSSLAVLEVIGQHQHNKSLKFYYYISWPQKGDTNGLWLNVIKRFCYHLTVMWREHDVELIYKEVASAPTINDALMISAEIRYREPYRLPVVLMLPTASLVLLSRHYTNVEYKTFWASYHHFNIHLWSKHHDKIRHIALHGSSYQQGSHAVSVAELLLFMPEVDGKKVLQNFIGVHYRRQMRALFAYTPTLEPNDVRWVVSDLFESNLLAKLPKALADDWSFQLPAQNITHWQELNAQVLKDLARSVQEGRLELMAISREWLVQEVINPYQQQQKESFEQQYQRLVELHWLNFSKQQQLQLADQLHNRQWAQLLVLKPEFEQRLRPLMSGRRLATLQDDVRHLEGQGVSPYVQALAVVEQILYTKY